MKEQIKVIELFAGVGGFRLGLERTSDRFKIVWSNQWEPSTKVQHASDIYVKNFGFDGHHNEDISKIPGSEIPDHDLLVGGFPCQDYSVAKTLNHAKGLQGKKGVLWWEIHRIVDAKRPKYLLLENVDRLLKSPAKQRGRDFAIMLASLSDLGYAVEWRVVNAADYGMPQRRRRIFIFACNKSTQIFKELSAMANLPDWIFQNGLFAKAFPVDAEAETDGFAIHGELDEISETFNKVRAPSQMALFNVADYFESIDRPSPFRNAGVMIPRMVSTSTTAPRYEGKRTYLEDVILRNGVVQSEYYLPAESINRWKYLKESKSENGRTREPGSNTIIQKDLFRFLTARQTVTDYHHW